MKTLRFREDLVLKPEDVDWFDDKTPGPDGHFQYKVVDRSDGRWLGDISFYGIDEHSQIREVYTTGGPVEIRDASVEECVQIIAERCGFILESKESKRAEFIKTVAGELVLKLLKDGKTVDEASKEAVEIGTKLFDNIYIN